MEQDDTYVFSKDYTGPCRRKFIREVPQERRRDRVRLWHAKGQKAQRKENLNPKDTNGKEI